MEETSSPFPEIERRLASVDPHTLGARAVRSELASRLEHALWSPLQHLRNATGRLLETDLDATQRDHAELAVATSQVILGLLGAHLDLVQDHEPADQEPAVFDPQKVLSPVLKVFASRARCRGLEVSCSFSASLPRALVGYPGRLRRAASILLEEGLRSASASSLRLRLECEETDHQRVELKLGVRGLEDDPACVSGLAVCRKVARDQGGRLLLDRDDEGRPRAGVVARFERFPERRRQRRDVGRGRPPLRLLLVDSLPGPREELARDLRERGLEVDTVDDLTSALELFGVSGCDYRAALIDARTWDEEPERGREVREALGNGPVVLSSRTLSRVLLGSDEERGVADVLYAPVLPWELQETLFESAAGPRLLDDEDPEPAAAVGPLEVLLADSNAAHRKHARGLIDRLGHRVIGVSDGLSALENLEQRAFDLAVLDASLSGLDAVSVARLVRAHESRAGGRMKIVALTLDPLQSPSAPMLEAGIDACLSKPLELDHLAWTITRLCHGEGQPETGVA